MTSTPAAAAADPAAHCRACARFIGPAAACPYCGDLARPSRGLRALRLFALLAGALGLLALYAGARLRGAPAVALSDLAGVAEYAYVRVAGRVAAAPYVRPAQGPAEYVAFDLADGTNQLRIALSGVAARELSADAAGLPRAGEPLEVAGTLRLTAHDGRRLAVPAAACVRRRDAAATASP